MLLVRGFALLLLLAIAALAVDTAVPQRNAGKVAVRASSISLSSQLQTFAAVTAQGECGEEAACRP
jgi:hypothetical protein